MATTSFESYQLQDGTFIYKINGIKVSQAEYNRKKAEADAKMKASKESAKKGQEDLLESAKKGQEDLLGMRKEDFLKETPAQRKKRMFEKLKGNAKGGIVKRYKGGLMVKPKAAKRGY